ncbi:hypothetical protein PJI16_05715 [Nitrospira sp. MA-1]|nr:hypothetical protein [Nitrospira sp. MA-1]
MKFKNKIMDATDKAEIQKAIKDMVGQAVSMNPDPNPWSIMEEFTKTVVTLSSALLAITVTFSGKLIGDLDSWASGILVGSWACGAASIICGVAAHGLIVRFLKTKKGAWATRMANTAFIFLVISTTGIAGYGFLMAKNSQVSSAVEIAQIVLKDMPNISGLENTKWDLISLEFNNLKNIYSLIITEKENGQKYNVSITSKGKILRTNKINAA